MFTPFRYQSQRSNDKNWSPNLNFYTGDPAGCASHWGKMLNFCQKYLTLLKTCKITKLFEFSRKKHADLKSWKFCQLHISKFLRPTSFWDAKIFSQTFWWCLMQILLYWQKWIFYPVCNVYVQKSASWHHLDYFLNFSETFGDNLLLGAKKKRFGTHTVAWKSTKMSQCWFFARKFILKIL